MGKCKKKNCNNKVEEGKRYCKYHRSKMESIAKTTANIGAGVIMVGIGFFKMIKK